MKKVVLVFIPNTFSTNKSGFIQGFHRDYPNFEAYYITNSEVLSHCGNHIGYTGKILTREFLPRKTIFIENGTNNVEINDDDEKELHITKIIYDYDAFQNCGAVEDVYNTNYGILIDELTKILAQNNNKIPENGDISGLLNCFAFLNLIIKIFSKLKPVTKNCAVLNSFYSSIASLKWFLNSFGHEKKLSPRAGNLLVAKIIDFALGIVLIYFCLKYKCAIVTYLDYIAQEFVSHLRQLLIYLMGSPIGLKLNYALNHSLGRFFFYHINLWRVFLQTMQPPLEANFKLLLLPAIFGISYQIAMICDIISVATFHVYCIYVYAARLFALQVKGLSSLWRLFIGRKSNPLRNRVDSCEYSSNQLFIGTLGFTILLFLLPTTTMYYTVFAAFRLATLLTYKFFNKIKELISSMPLYIIILWSVRSPTIAGAFYLDWTESTSNETCIQAKLVPLSLNESIEKFSSNTDESTIPKHSLGTIISHLFTGQLV